MIMTRNGKITFTLCAYESVALALSGTRYGPPTITTMQRHVPILGAGVVLALAGHFVANDGTRATRYIGWLK